MKKYRSIADEVLRRKAQEEGEVLEDEKTDEFIREIVEKKLAEIEAEKEASKPDDIEVHVTKPMSDLNVHTVEPVIPLEVEKPVIQKKPVIQGKPVVEEKPVIEEPVEKDNESETELTCPDAPFPLNLLRRKKARKK